MPRATRTTLVVIAVLIVAAIVYVAWSHSRTTTGPDTSAPSSTTNGTSTLPTPAASGKPGAYVPPSGAWKTWTDSDYDKTTKTTVSYTLDYPRDFDVRTGNDAAGGNFMESTSRASISFPEDAYDAQKTNFAGGTVIISVANATGDADSCNRAPDDQNLVFKGAGDINGVGFFVATTSDAGAGNFYDSRVYRTVYSGHCYEFVLVIHTTNVGNYDPGTVTEFDKNQAWSVLESIFRSVKFTTKTDA